MLWMPRRGGPSRRSSQADSIVIDPHKHGLQPYGCGCVLFRDPAVGRFYKHDSPYTYFTSKQLHLGEISLECSRAGAAAVALWATQQLLPLTPGGEFARGLARGRAAAVELDRRLRHESRRFQPLAAGAPELDIVVWKVNGETPEAASELAQRIFLACAARDLHLALVQLPHSWFEPVSGRENVITPRPGMVTCLRSVLMKPEHAGLARQNLGKVKRGLRGGHGRRKMNAEVVTRIENENVLIQIGDCAVTILPHLGGKISSILVKGNELLQAPLAPTVRAPAPWALTRATPAAGMSACPRWPAAPSQTANGPVDVPDHGDLWRVAWQVLDCANGSITMRGECFSLPLELLRTVILTRTEKGYRLHADYKVTNTGAAEAPWAWSAHPGYASEAGDRVLLPDSIRTLRLESSGGCRLGKGGDSVAWPIAKFVTGGETDLSVVTPAETGTGDKLFAGPLTAAENWCALERPSAGVRLRVSFDPSATPYLGLWICSGGWPDRPGTKQHCVALEPATAPVDSLAITGPWSRTLAPGESYFLADDS